MPRVRVIPRAEWGASKPNGAGPAPLPAVEGAFLHHAVVTAPTPSATVEQERAAMRNLERIGHARFGAGISYNVAVMPSGRAYEGVSLDRRGSHTKGYNTTGRAIVLVGQHDHAAPDLPPVTEPTPAALETVAALLADWTDAGVIPAVRLRPHRAVKQTACPGALVVPHLPGIIARARDLRDGPTRPPTPTGDDMTTKQYEQLSDKLDDIAAAIQRVAQGVMLDEASDFTAAQEQLKATQGVHAAVLVHEQREQGVRKFLGELGTGLVQIAEALGLDTDHGRQAVQLADRATELVDQLDAGEATAEAIEGAPAPVEAPAETTV